MHNGVYHTLEEVIKFYSNGGVVGIGTAMPFPSLPYDSFKLDAKEKRAIVVND